MQRPNQAHEEKQKAANSTTINIGNFRGIFGDVSGSTVSQRFGGEVPQGDFEALKEQLVSIGVSDEAVLELRQAIEADGPPKDDKTFGRRVSAWVGRMVARAAEGSWQVSLATAGTVLSKILTDYLFGG